MGSNALSGQAIQAGRDTIVPAQFDTLQLRGLPQPITLGDLARLPERQFLALVIETEFGHTAPNVTRQILGTVLEGDSLAHILYGTRLPAFAPDLLTQETETAHLSRDAGEWRIARSMFLALVVGTEFGHDAPNVTRQILGTVLEGDSLAHILYRTRLPAFAPDLLTQETQTAHLSRDAGEWRIARSMNLLGSGMQLWSRVMFAGPR